MALDIFEPLIELIVEVGIRGVGSFLCRLVGLRVDPDSTTALLVGLIFWLLVIVAIVMWIRR